jgi:hypothetical protein
MAPTTGQTKPGQMFLNSENKNIQLTVVASGQQFVTE